MVRATQGNVTSLAEPEREFRLTTGAALALINYPTQFIRGTAANVVVTAEPARPYRVTEASLLVLVKSNPDQKRMRAWTFTMDGHHFYVLKLGQLGTYVYDKTTKRWSEWRSFGRKYWRGQVGMNWGEETIAGDTGKGWLYNIDPVSNVDYENEPIIRVVTGGLPQRLRNALSCNGVTLSAHAQGAEVKVTLRTSDDGGEVFHTQRTLIIRQAGEEITWRSLGTIHAPGRIFEITDDGLARIDGLDMW